MLISLVILCFLCALAYILIQTRKPKNYPPGPLWKPFIGNVSEVKKLSIALGGQHLAFDKMSKDYNTLILGVKLGPEKFIIVSSYRLIKEIFTGEEYEGRPDNFFIRLRSFGTRKGVTCTDGPFWNEHRSFLMRHMRNLGYGKKSMETQIKAETDEIIDILGKGEKVVDVTPIFSISVINVIWAIATGKRFVRNDEKLVHFLDLLQKRSKAFDMSGGTLSQFPWLRFVIPEKSGYNLINQLNMELRNFFLESINEHRNSWYPGRSDDLIYTYLSQMADEKQDTTYTEDQLIMVCIDLFIAGSTTTSGALSFLFLVMLLYPDVQEKIIKHMNSVLLPDEPITYTDRLRLPYVEAVILETQRFFTIVPIAGPRRVLRDTTMEGYTIPKNTTVLINIESVHKDVEYWNDPNVFRPERFINEEGKFIPGDRVMTFGLGRRRCLGELIARQSIFMFFSSIIRKFQVCIPAGEKSPSSKPLPGITLSPQKYKIQLIPR